MDGAASHGSASGFIRGVPLPCGIVDIASTTRVVQVEKWQNPVCPSLFGRIRYCLLHEYSAVLDA